jgi:hypothetical protein
MEDYKNKFRDLLEESITIEEFENWIYTTQSLEDYFNQNDYLELISFNYKKANYYDLRKLLSKHIDLSKIETDRVLKLLKKLISKSCDVISIEKELDFLSHNLGYYFLDEITFPYINYSSEENNNQGQRWFYKLDEVKQKIITDHKLLIFSMSIEKLINAIENGQLKIIHEKNKKFRINDARSYEDKVIFDCLPKEVFVKQWR